MSCFRISISRISSPPIVTVQDVPFTLTFSIILSTVTVTVTVTVTI
jgi:hypothetical protein